MNKNKYCVYGRQDDMSHIRPGLLGKYKYKFIANLAAWLYRKRHGVWAQTWVFSDRLSEYISANTDIELSDNDSI